MAHEAYRKLEMGGAQRSFGCIPVSVLLEQSPVQSNNCLHKDRLGNTLSRVNTPAVERALATENADCLCDEKLASAQALLIAAQHALLCNVVGKSTEEQNALKDVQQLMHQAERKIAEYRSA